MKGSTVKQRLAPALLALFCAGIGACQAGPGDADGNVEKAGAALTVHRHLLLIIERSPVGFWIDEVYVIDAPVPRTRFERELDWRVVLEDHEGQTLFSTTIQEGGIVRGAFALADGGVESIHERRQTFAFAIRMPLMPHAERVRFWDTRPKVPSGSTPSARAPADVELGSVDLPSVLP